MEFFGEGENWRQHVYQGDDGGRCLVGAANHVQVSSIDDAKHWLRQAIEQKTGKPLSIEQFNDTRSSFAEIPDVLDRARELARTGGRQVPALVGEVLPPVRPALPSPVANGQAVVAWGLTPAEIEAERLAIKSERREARRRVARACGAA